MSHFAVAPMPLRRFLEVITDPDAPERPELEDVQQALSEHAGHEVAWDEPEPASELDVLPLEDECLFALKAAGAWLFVHGDLEGFEVGSDPLEHPVWEELLERTEDGGFPQLVSTWTGDVVYVPADMERIVETEWHGQDDEGYILLVGSLPRLEAELEVVGRALGEDPDAPLEERIFDEDEDPLAAPKYAWQVLWQELRAARRQHLPLFLTWDPTSSGETWDA
ncbi:MAG: hypothetical protein ACQEXJ_22760 [Myxococcota bacterium]